MNCIQLLAKVNAILLVAAILAPFPATGEEPRGREVRIGVDQAAPYQSWREGYGPVGFTVDVLENAARRRGIKLNWINCPEGPGKALAAGKVDMWPLLGVEVAKKYGIYVAEPWLQNEYAVAWRREAQNVHGTAPDWDGKTISVVDLPMSLLLANRYFTRSQFDRTPNRTVAFQHLCAGAADAAFMEVRLIEPMLLERPKGCDGFSLGVRVIPGMTQSMSLVARPQLRGLADELRAEIGLMFLDGRFGEFVDNWFVFSNIEARSLVELLQQRQRNTYVTAALAVTTLLTGLLLWAFQMARRARRSAERANQSKSNFLANVSHEIRTPMNGVIGMSDLLLGTPLTAEQQEYTTTIGESARLQLVLLNDLLDSAKIEAGKLTLETIAFCPADLLKEAQRTFHGVAIKKGIQLEARLANVPPGMMGDPIRIRQILSNLLSNALKFTEVGEVLVTMEGELTTSTSGLVITVKDTGIGIPAEMQGRLFEKFMQAEHSTTRRFGGTGLGLSICRDLTELMGGSIQFESRVGEGTTFRVTLPLPISDAPIEERTANATEVALTAALPILVVEDNAINQKVAAAILRSFGLAFAIASNGLEAVQMCIDHEYAAILMDCQMPHMDGFEATRRIREMNRGHVPIIALTAGTADAERQHALQAGMDDFLPKPISRLDVRVTLGRWLPAQSTSTQQEREVSLVEG